MDEWNISSAMPGYHSLGGEKNDKKAQNELSVVLLFWAAAAEPWAQQSPGQMHAQTPSIYTRLHIWVLDISTTFADICGHV